MLMQLRNKVLSALSFLLSDGLAQRLAKLLTKRFVEQVRTNATDDFLELLLRAMNLAFCLSRKYRKNLDDFSAKYVFSTADGKVGATARFDGGHMHVEDAPAEDFTVRVRFKDANALRRFLFGKKQDILGSVLDNDVQVDGNINYVYKFGFMARALERQLGIAA